MDTQKTYPLISEARKKNWQNPAYRVKVLTSCKHVIDTRMKERLIDLASKGVS